MDAVLLENEENVGVLGPPTTVHKPLPVDTAVAASVVLVPLHNDWSVPALAALGGVLTISSTSS